MKILLADDDSGAMEDVIQTLVEYGGHTVKKVSTIPDAESEFTGGVWGYELFIIDVQMKPGKGEKTTEEEALVAGLALLRRFRARFEHEKVLILTNNLHRVPADIYSGNLDTRARDKVDVSGRRILDLIKNW